MKPFIRLSSYIKISAICLVDLLNELRDPFVEFTRPIIVKDPALLSDKAARFEQQFNSRFLQYGSIFAYQLPINTGDQALYQGHAAAMFAIKYSVTKDPADLANLKIALKGMDEHQTIHGEETRRLVRGWRLAGDGGVPVNNADQTFIIKGNVVIEDWASNDSVAGHVLGIYFAWLYGDAEAIATAKILAKGIGDEVMANNGLIDATGAATPLGLLLNGTFTDPLRLATYMATMRVASAITGDAQYEVAYDMGRTEYGAGGYANYAKVKLWSWDTDADTQRAAFLLSILADSDKTFSKGLARTWQLVHKSMNVWVAYLAARNSSLDVTEVQNCKKILTEFTLEDKFGNTQKINSTNMGPFMDLITWGGHVRNYTPLPASQRGAQEFEWSRNLFSVDDWVGNTTPDTYFNGLDFLLAYWLGRKLSLISPQD